MTKFFTSEEVYKDRLAICKSCKYYFKLTGQCKRCLCFMKVKARLANQSCPVGKWDKEPLTIKDKTLDVINNTI